MKVTLQDIAPNEFHGVDVAATTGEWPAYSIGTHHDSSLSAATLPPLLGSSAIMVSGCGIIEENLAGTPPETIDPIGAGLPREGEGAPGAVREEDAGRIDYSGVQCWDVVNLKTLGVIVKWLRKNGPHTDRTQEGLAARMSLLLGSSVDQAAISRYEHGQMAPSLPTFVALANSLGIKSNNPTEMLRLAAMNPLPDPEDNAILDQMKARIAEVCFGVDLQTILADSGRRTRRKLPS